MKHNLTLFTLLLLFCFSTSLEAQKNPMLQQANKEFDLHAYNLAIKSYRKVIDKDPDNVDAYVGTADCYRLLGRMTESADWYKKALQLPDVDPAALFHYGKTLMALGEYEKAAEWFLVYAEGQPVYGNHFAESCNFAISLRGIPSSYRVKKEFINTDASDFGPAFFKGNVVFSSSRTDMVRQMEKDRSSWDGAAKNQLFISGLDANGFLTKPTFLQNDLQNVYNQGPITYSKDGKWLAFTKNNFVNGTRQAPEAGLEGSIFVASAKADGSWDDALPFPHNGSGYASVYPHLSADGQRLYFSSNRPDGYGGFDIYVSYRIGSTWASPENLGPIVNTAGNEITPYMDNDMLYFASDWHPGLGGMDIFRAVTEEGLWSKVFHVGNAVNSPSDDYGLIIDAKANKGYFVSNRNGGAGNEDIYSLSKISEDAVIAVTDAGTGKALGGAILDFTACGSSIFPADESGKYRFQVFDGLVCNVVVSLDGYKSTVVKLDAAAKNNNAYTVTLEKVPNLVSGLLFNSRDNRPVDEVVITAQAKGSDEQLRTTSSANGSYQLGLQPNTSYIIRYSKAGYLNMHQQIETGATIDKDILGVLMLNTANTNLEEKTEVVVAGPPKKSSENTTPTNNGTTKTDNTGSTGKSSNTTIDLVTSSLGKEGATTDVNTRSTNDENANNKMDDITTAKEVVAQEGYAVQIAAVGLDEKLNNNNYLSLSGIGNLYSRPHNGMQKVRVGIYRTKEEAAEVRKTIVAKGFAKAFVVNETVVNQSEINVFDSAPTLEPAPIPKEETPVPKKPETSTKPIVETPAITNSLFMVRLATYTKPEFFDPTSVEKIGKVEQRLKGKMTIMLLTGFPTLQSANDAMKEAVRLGYTGAHVVMEENGKLIKI